MGRVQDKGVLVTGGARGQGRNHAVKLAEEGLEVEKAGQRAYTAVVGVRDRGAVAQSAATVPPRQFTRG